VALYRTPDITPDRRAKLEELDDLRRQLGARVVPGQRWVQLLRRSSQASAWASSTRIEGFNTSFRRAEGLLAQQAPADDDDHAFLSYARAMQHVEVLAEDDEFDWSRRLLLDLHFDVCSFQRKGRVGRFREGPVYVTDGHGGIAFTGPPPEALNQLVAEFIEQLQVDRSHPLVCAAMAHLNLISIHPFDDGNGRISRVVQSLVIARTGETAPEFGSIEPYLARNTVVYYNALITAQRGGFNPGNPADEWLDFCLEAHRDQAISRLELVEAAAVRWQELEQIAARYGWPDRLAVALEQALAGEVTRTSYAREAEIADPTASADLRRLVDAGLIKSAGGGRTTSYSARSSLKRKVSAALRSHAGRV
jgi:Fic family protein